MMDKIKKVQMMKLFQMNSINMIKLLMDWILELKIKSA